MKRKICALRAEAVCSAALNGCGKESLKEEQQGDGEWQELAQADESAANSQKDSDQNTMQSEDSKTNARQGTDKETIELTVWGAEEDTELMEQILSSFQKEYEKQADFQITYNAQGESGCKDALLGDLENGADVFTFADDQLNALAAAGALEPVENADAIKNGHLERAVEAASVSNTVYAYPLTADNGYFLYYNKEFFKPDDVKSLDTILEIAADNGRLFSMDWTSAWYVYAFFGNTGMEVGLNEDGITNYCTWNAEEGKVKGVDAARAMIDIAANPGFISLPDAEFIENVQNGTVIAGISGVWNAVAVEECWGENMGAAKLPEYTCGSRQVQMASFAGCKLIGVNAYSKSYEWAEKLAEWIISEQNQKLRFEMRGQGPSNIKAAQSEEVQSSAAIAAILDQSEYSQLQRIGGKFWEPVQTFAANMLQGNPAGEDLQKQLDQMVEKITAR